MKIEKIEAQTFSNLGLSIISLVEKIDVFSAEKYSGIRNKMKCLLIIHFFDIHWLAGGSAPFVR